MKAHLKKMEAAFGSAIHINNFGRSEQIMIEIEVKRLVEISLWLRMEESFRMDLLENISIYELKEKFIFSYFLRSHSQNLELVLRTSFAAPNGNDPVNHPSVREIWPQAEPFETEQGALFGIHFGVKKTKQGVIRNFGDFSGYPLRRAFEWGEKVEF